MSLGRVVIGNPGALQEMPIMAAAFAKASLLREYVTPFGSPKGFEPRWTVWLPSVARRRVAYEIRKRDLPCEIDPSQVHLAGSLYNAMFVTAQRIRILRPLRRPLLRLNNEGFDRLLARRIRPGDACVIPTHQAALSTIRRARILNVPTLLEANNVHYLHAERLLQQEARLNPHYSQTLQFHDLPSRDKRRADSEYREADRILALCTYHKNTYLENGIDESRILMTPLGVDSTLFRPMPRVDDGVFRILFKGQITQRKGISYLIDAFTRAAIPNSELLLAGQVVGESRMWRGIPGVRHLPHVPYIHQLPEIYAQADVFVSPSIVEGFLITGLEAMSCGLPTIVSTNTFATDVITDGKDGFVIPIRDSNAIVDRLRLLHEDPDLRAAIGRRARARALQFTWERYGESVIAAVGDLRVDS
jgi:glycosyltransferase involved in cell wall biosynthesis